MKITHAVWERKNLGVDAYEIALDANDTPQMLKQADQEVVSQGAQYLVVKTPVACPQLLFHMTELGYSFVETVFHVMVKRSEYQMPASIARFDRGMSVRLLKNEAEQERVYAAIRAGVFETDRVSIDPAFTKAESGNRYANWTKQMADNGCFLYETLQGDRPFGFFIIKRVDEQTVDPVLMGMYQSRDDRGLGTLLHKKTLDTCFTHECARLTSTIVSNNFKVLRVYLNAGASITETLYTYVRHVGGRDA